MVQRDVRRSVFVGHHYRQDVVPSLARERGSVVVDREKVLIYPFFYCPFVAPSSFVVLHPILRFSIRVRRFLCGS